MYVSQLFVHPVKSCAGLAVQRWPLDARGLRWDRHWAFVDPDGVVVTARAVPRLLLIQPQFQEDTLLLNVAGLSALRLPLTHGAGPRLAVQVWDDVCEGEDQGDAAAAWASEAAGQPLRVVRRAADFARKVESFAAPPGTVTDFADAFPILVATDASLADLHSRLLTPVDMRRFRPNIVIADSEPWAEDGWRRLQVGQAQVALCKPCARCGMTTVDPDTAERGQEPLKTLAEFRRVGKDVHFGQNAIVVQPGEVAVGDRVKLQHD